VKEPIIDLANAIRIERYGDAAVVFAAGSIIRGEGTPFSDLDLVVVYGRLPNAYRESLRAKGYPVEAFVHDPETLEYFYMEVDRPAGVPALAQMVVEGIEIPGSTELSQKLKRRAAAAIEAGPPALDRDEERRMRYSVSDLLDDLRSPRSRAELIAAGARMFGQLADYYLRRRGLWSATGKAIPRVLQRTDAALCTSYCDAFEELFARGNPHGVIRLTEDLLSESGGPLFDGYRADAPPAWRREPSSPPDPR
jgi:predicted nucleotidyltransferase